ncbi:hypothetical protein ACOME3_004898 [Neoechinorhynchus agilis]
MSLSSFFSKKDKRKTAEEDMVIMAVEMPAEEVPSTNVVVDDDEVIASSKDWSLLDDDQIIEDYPLVADEVDDEVQQTEECNEVEGYKAQEWDFERLKAVSKKQTVVEEVKKEAAEKPKEFVSAGKYKAPGTVVVEGKKSKRKPKKVDIEDVNEFPSLG